MEYRRLGKSGLKVSEICLGTMTFGHGTNEKESERMVHLAVDAGVNFFDTANSYGEGESEVLLGKAIKNRRRDAIIATKFFNPMGKGPNDSGMSRVHIMQAIDDSLKRLQMDYVDIYYIHHVDTQTPLDEMLKALDDLVRQGKVRYTACSNYQAWRLSEALWICESNNLEKFVCYQPIYNLVVRDIEQELVPLCKNKGLGIVVWSPLAGGFLSGKYKPGERIQQGSRSEEGWAFPQRYFASNADETLQTLIDISEKLGYSPAQVALRWVLEQEPITSVIVGARRIEHLIDNLGTDKCMLNDQELKRLSEISFLPDRYPEAMEKNMHERRDNAVNMPIR